MRTYIDNGIYYKGTVYVLEKLEDWDEYEKICAEENSDFQKYNPNFYAFKEEFKQFIGKIWEDKTQVKYAYNGEPICEQYKVIGLEDNAPWGDWYWIIQNVTYGKDIKYILANSPTLKDGIKN